MATTTIAALNIYPIKSCRGVSLQSAVLTEAGLALDRQWMVVREESGRFLTQREKGILALVEVSLPLEALHAAQWGTERLPPDAALTLTAPGAPGPLKVPLRRRPDSEIRKVTVWEWTGAGADEGPDAAAWFSALLGLPCRLVRYLGSGSGGEKGPLPVVRTTEPEYAVNYETRFSDGYPMLLVTQSALSDLNAKLPAPLPMNRFRPNIEVAGADPWAEDGWRDMEVSPSAGGAGIKLTAVKPCSRCKTTTIDQATGQATHMRAIHRHTCKTTTIDQATGQAGDEPLDTLHTFRTGKALGWAETEKSWTHAVFFGWNVVSRTPGVLSVGDRLTVRAPQGKALVPAP
ncbi:hypothetical protein HYH03_016339 [Edaphochlamys debaryana]|uniref:MOSC domain-containing protein n=1 Tax=Edaphochlamys debaryana TaxID=47281 RepID=A0A835XKG8_9CHLO|nr:hypothetical protein HYH03_016339 [Edaphochlamys debaryana]|eukprot:KAG2484852.1 hypothetical protein HYH03_016339 [Edaphochlamys debaryana]